VLLITYLVLTSQSTIAHVTQNRLRQHFAATPFNNDKSVVTVATYCTGRSVWLFMRLVINASDRLTFSLTSNEIGITWADALFADGSGRAGGISWRRTRRV